jgi:hypothetical protein
VRTAVQIRPPRFRTSSICRDFTADGSAETRSSWRVGIGARHFDPYPANRRVLAGSVEPDSGCMPNRANLAPARQAQRTRDWRQAEPGRIRPRDLPGHESGAADRACGIACRVPAFSGNQGLRAARLRRRAADGRRASLMARSRDRSVGAARRALVGAGVRAERLLSVTVVRSCGGQRRLRRGIFADWRND